VKPPRLFNKTTDTIPEDAVYIGRPGPFGNPFVIGEHGDRAAVIAQYRAWLPTQPALVERMQRELPGRDLVCFCAPLPCHGDVILALVNPSPTN
jgi:hypothetical protein